MADSTWKQGFPSDTPWDNAVAEATAALRQQMGDVEVVGAVGRAQTLAHLEAEGGPEYLVVLTYREAT